MAITVFNYTTQTETTFAVGQTLQVYTASYQIMSDIWGQALKADYWDDAEAMVKTVTIDIWEYSRSEIKGSAVEDATPAVLEKVAAYYYDRALQDAIRAAEAAAQTIQKGSKVTVVKGRQGKGVTGKVVVQIDRPYAMGYKSVMREKVGIATSEVMVKVTAANGRVYDNYQDVVWAWAMNCQLVEVPEINMEEVKERAQAEAEYRVGRYAKA